jgi:hypothetical protein
VDGGVSGKGGIVGIGGVVGVVGGVFGIVGIVGGVVGGVGVSVITPHSTFDLMRTMMAVRALSQLFTN